MSRLRPVDPEGVPRRPDHVDHVEVGEVALHVRRFEPSEATGAPVLLVHGLASNARLWDGVAAELVAAGHPVAALDQRGHGRSSAPDDPDPDPDPAGGYDMAAVTDDLAALLDVLAGSWGPTPPVVAGQSWGGNVVVELAARFPGRTAAICCVDGGAIHLARQFPDWDDCAEALAPPPIAGTPAADLEAMIRSSHPDWPESGIAGTLACFEVRDDGTVAPWLTRERHLRVLRGLWEHVPSERWPLVAEPVLFLTAEDPAADAGWRESKARGMSEAQARLSDVTVEWITGHHDLHAQHPALVARHLRDLAARATGR